MQRKSVTPRLGVGRHCLAGTALVLTTAALVSADILELDSTNPIGGGEYGRGVAIVGDVNGDGYADVAVGAPDEDVGATDEAGRVYIYSGKTGNLIRTHTSPNLEAVGWFGQRIVGIGDVNNDGRADYVISAPNQGAGVEGDLYAYSGSNGALLWSVNGWFYRTGGSLGVVPDCSGDGLPELVVGYAGPGDYGSVRVLQAKNGALWKTLNSPIPNGQESSFGTAVAGVADLTGDGKGDVIVGAPQAAPGSAPLNAGRVYVFNGVTGALHDTVVSTDQQINGNFGNAVAGIGDISGDGRGDLIIGARGEVRDGSALSEGQVHVHSGNTGNWIRTLNSTDPTAGGDFGFTVASCGDVDGDGKPDIWVGAPDEAVTGIETGRVYNFSGATGVLIESRNAPGSVAERYGRALDASGDVNNDGLPDLLVGAPSTDVAPLAAVGRAYLYRLIENDGCALFIAPPQPVTDGTWPFTTVGASTTGPAAPQCLAFGSDQIESDVFFSYTATCTGTLTVSICNSADYDTRLGLYLGCSFGTPPLITCNLSNIVACNDDTSGCGTTSRLQVPVVQGTCYRIRIGGFLSAQGSGTFTVSCAGNCPGDVNLNGIVDAADLTLLLGQWNGPGSADLNGDGIVNGPDLAILLGAWGNC